MKKIIQLLDTFRDAETIFLHIKFKKLAEYSDEELVEYYNKTFEVGQGRIEMEVNKVNAEESEIGGVFVASQPGDTDMGSKVPKKILTKGIFYAKVQQ